MLGNLIACRNLQQAAVLSKRALNRLENPIK